MMKLHTQYVTDTRGRRRAIQLPLHEFERLLELLEDLEDRAYLKKSLHRGQKLISMTKVHTAPRTTAV